MLLWLIMLSLFMHIASPDERAHTQQKRQHQPNMEPHIYNLTVTELRPNSLSLSWSCRNHHLHDKYEVTLKPLKATYRVVETVPHNSCYLTMENLVPDTVYQVFITLFSRNLRRRSNIVIVKTPLEEIETELYPVEEDIESSSREIKIPDVRVVELSLVGMALVLWIGAIVLFFHRWGKIRMLLPYQPDYKKEDSTNFTPHHQCSRLPQIQPEYPGSGVVGPIGLVSVADSGCSPLRPRLNSFIGFTSTDSQIPAEVRLFRKTKSAEFLTLGPTKCDEEFADF